MASPQPKNMTGTYLGLARQYLTEASNPDLPVSQQEYLREMAGMARADAERAKNRSN